MRSRRRREAIRLAPDHPLGWTWRFGFVANWAALDPKIDRAEAVRYLDEVLRSRGPSPALRERIGRLRVQLQK